MINNWHKDFNWATITLEMCKVAEAIQTRDFGILMHSLNIINETAKQLEKSYIAEVVSQINRSSKSN